MKKKTVIILANPVVAKLHDPSAETRTIVAEMVSFSVAAAEHMGSRSWNGESSFYNMKSNTFPAGFVRMVQKRLELQGYRVLVKRKEAPAPAGPENPKVDNFPDDPRYNYQPEVVRRLISLKGMVAMVSTGGGKSKIFKLACERLGLPTLFVTTRKSLMYQMFEDYEANCGRPVGILGDGKWTPKPNGVNFAIVDTLVSRLEKKTIQGEVEREVEREFDRVEKLVRALLKKNNLPEEVTRIHNPPPQIKAAVEKIRQAVYNANPLDRKAMAEKVTVKVRDHEKRRLETVALLKNIGFLCLEEAHEVSGSGFYDIAQSCVNAHYRLSLTATPFMKDDEEANMRLMAVTGPIGIRVTEKLLIDRGILAKPYFKYIRTTAPAGLARGSAWQRAYAKGIVENDQRNEAIVAECKRAKHYGLPIMILVQHSKHGETLERMLMKAGINTRFIYGKHEQKDRKSALQALGSGKIDALIGSTILDVGVDVPSVGLVVLAGGGKAEVSLRQRVGRGLRAKKSGPNVAYIVDFEDRFNNHLSSHYKERRRIIDDTPGFAENVVTDFDYVKQGFKAAA